MDLPKNARVVVVDNEPDEVSDLLAVLAKEGVATLYYTGPSGFPDLPLTGIRLLFLDLELAGLETADSPTKASAAAATLKKLIGADNGPLMVVIWTDHAEVADLAKRDMLQVAKMPLFVMAIDKADCRITGTTDFSIEKIKVQINAKLAQASADIIGLYVTWENAVFTGTTRLAERLSGVSSGNGDAWAKIMSRAFYKLFEAECGTGVQMNPEAQFLNACHLYNRGLAGYLNASLAKTRIDATPGFAFNATPLQGGQEDALSCKLNAFLFYDALPHGGVVAGDVYAVEAKTDSDIKLEKALLRDFGARCEDLDSLAQSTDIYLCKVVITPPCDAANNKKLKVPPCHVGGDCVQYDRYAWALLVCGGVRSRFSSKTMDRAYGSLRGFEFNGATCDLLVDLYALGTEVVDVGSMRWLLTLKPIPLADIQSKAANQLNRIGICSVK